MTAQTTVPGGQTSASAQLAAMLALAEQRMNWLLEAERSLWSGVNAAAVTLVDEVSRLVAAGGKRLRPLFCLAGYAAAGGSAQGKVIIDAAAALEFLHAFALIHDDVLDDSELRRGIPTVHVRHIAEHAARDLRGESRRYGEGVAILAGDLAYVYADRLTASLPAQAREIWGVLRTEMIIGQFLDIRVAADFTPDPAMARWIAQCKSGRYSIQRPLEFGAAIAGRADLASAFERYGVALGEAFQLRDDLLDAFGDSGSSGKPAGLDFARHKMTLLMALAIQADGRVGEILQQALAGGQDFGQLRGTLISLGVRDEVESRITALVDEACAAIRQAPVDGRWSEVLADMAHRVAYRDR